MGSQTATVLVRTPEILTLSAGDPFVERAREINELIARRAHELFESRGCAHGHDREDWLTAMSEVLLHVPVDITETETELAIRADVPGFNKQDLEVRVAPRSVCITGKRQEASEQTEGETVYSERRSNQVFRVLDLPSQIDPDRVNATLSDGILEIRLLKLGMGKKIPILTKAAAA